MNFKFHRGTKEIGGSCVEIWTESTRILIDFGMPLVNKDKSEFNFNLHKHQSTDELIQQGVLPNIKGLYGDAEKTIDAVILSHSHQDHYGLIYYIDKEIRCYLGEATHELIKVSNKFIWHNNITIENPVYFEKEKTFQIGDISVTPYWVDHSAFDAYSFLVEAKGKRLFYSGDFRNHGRKSNVFKWFTHNAPQNVDYLLLEGTSVGRECKPHKTEVEVEKEFLNVFKENYGINFIYVSGQNIDRIVSIFRACIKADKILVVDVYVAKVLKTLSKFANLPYPSENYKNLKVIYTGNKIVKASDDENKKIMYEFKRFKITDEEISGQPNKYVILVRPSMKKKLDKIQNVAGGNFIYSMWDGYLSKAYTDNFVKDFMAKGLNMHTIHTSGHADTATLKRMVEAINPKHIIPIHTFSGGDYAKLFNAPVMLINDGETVSIP